MVIKKWKEAEVLQLLVVVVLLAAKATWAADGDGYYGKYIGKLKSLHHGVSGEVYAVDARTLHIRNFNYDGEGPAAYFYAGDSKSPNSNGFRINDEKGSPNVLPKYRNKHITLTLPENKTLRDIRWFSVWCDEFSVNFGDVRISKTFEYPRPQKIDALGGVHGVSSENIVVVDAQTLLIPSFSYDGEAPDAKFWVGRGSKPSPQGIRVPDENGKEVPLRRYDRKTIVLTLPGDLTVYDVGHFGVWCEAFTVDFGHVRIPRALNVPPSLKMLGVSPQSKLNCEVLLDENAFEVRWAVAGDSVVIQLVGKIDDGEYMSFGLSGDDTRSKMVGGDVAVVWVNHSSLAGDARDYFLDSKSQCAGTRGSCPDQRLREGTNSIRLLNAAMVNGYSIVTYQRPLHAKDELDRAIVTNGSQPIVWALGPLNSRNEVSYHRVANRHDVLIDFARSPKWNCPIPDSEGGAASNTEAQSSSPTPSPTPSRGRTTNRPQSSTTHHDAVSEDRPSSRRTSSRQPSPASATASAPPATPAPAPSAGAWDIPPIQCYEPEDGVFYAQMGPTGGKHGYPAITGHVGWGISWYINGLLIPEVNVVRGKTYTFIVEGGHDPETPARYHPFYITDDPVGGYEYKTVEERARARVFAGVRVNRRGEAYPTGTGRLCNWTPDPAQPPADEFASFGAYQRTLSLECEVGDPGVVEWTPDDNTPDTVYYQCYTHRYLGWKINVHDSCEAAAASEPVAAQLPPDQSAADDSEEVEEGELQSRPSIRVATRVRPEGVVYAGDKDLATSYQSFSSAGTTYTTSTGANQVDKLNLGEVYLPPAALQQQQEPQAYARPGQQQYIPLSDQSDGLDDVFTVQPDTASDYEAQKLRTNATADVILNKTPTVTEFPIKPSPIDLANPGTAAQHAQDSFASVPTTTPNAILPANGTKTTDVKLLSTARPAASNDHAAVVDPDGTKPTSEASPLVTPTFIYKRPIVHRPHGLAPHGYILPNGRPASLASHTMMLHRPQPYSVNPYRRPIPHRGYVPLHRPAASILRPTYISTPLPPNYLMTSKKPFYRVTMMTIPHRTMVSPSPYHRPLTTLTPRPILSAQQQQQSYASPFKNMYSLPPQRIKYDKLQAIASSSGLNSPVTLKPSDAKHQASSEAKKGETIPIISPAPLLSTSTEAINPNMPIAVNTGFRPETVVVEGGFKPIINKNIAQDRSSVEIDTEFVDQDEIVDRLEKEAASDVGITEKADVGDDRKDNPFKGQRPETFEPMFIPSPPDRVNQNSSDVDDLKPPAVSSQSVSQKVSSRARPAGKRPVYPVNGATPLRIPLRPASPSFRFQQNADETPGEVAMAAERMDTYYLPPSGYQAANNPPSLDSTPIPPGSVLAYDGKSVVDVSLASSISDPSASTSSTYQTPSGTAELIKGTPQFGPYRGDVPPPVPKVVHPESIPQLQNRNKQHSNTLPLQFNQRSTFYSHSTPNTRLTVVGGHDLSSAESETKELYAVYESKEKGGSLRDKAAFKKTSPLREISEETTLTDELRSTLAMAIEQTTTIPQQTDSSETETADTTDTRRSKRAAEVHHEPGHTGTAEDEGTGGAEDHHSTHDHHDHEHHSDASVVSMATACVVHVVAIGLHLTRFIF